MKFLLVVLCPLILFKEGRCQSGDLTVTRQETKYYVDTTLNRSLCFTIHNNSGEDIYIWFDRTGREKMSGDLYKQYFLSVKGDYSLMQMLSDQSVDVFSIVLFQTFIKRLPPGSAFEVIFNAQKGHPKGAVQNFGAHIIHFKKSELPATYVAVLKAAEDKLYKEDKIVLDPVRLSLK